MSDIYVLDASALLCLLLEERGAEKVLASLPTCMIGAVNLCEVVAKLSDRGGAPAEIDAALSALDLDVVAFDREQARLAGLMRSQTRGLGLSLGDRACLALGVLRNAVVLTCDASWARLEIGCAVELAR
ncbi:MAG: type II toxin-antitoxin system VapC family toxin [Roseiarcus sp.]